MCGSVWVSRAGRHRPNEEWKAMLLPCFHQGCLGNGSHPPCLLLIIDMHCSPIPELMLCLALGEPPQGDWVGYWLRARVLISVPALTPTTDVRLGEWLNPSGPQLAQIMDANHRTCSHRVVRRSKERMSTRHLEQYLTGGVLSDHRVVLIFILLRGEAALGVNTIPQLAPQPWRFRSCHAPGHCVLPKSIPKESYQ